MVWTTLVGWTAVMALAQDVPRAEVGAVVEPVLKEANIPGAVIGIWRNGQLVVREAFGVSNAESGESMTPDALFQVGSVTKVFTASLLAHLVSEGVVELEDAVSLHLDDSYDLPAWCDEVTLRDLAQHTSGLPRNPVNRRDREDGPSVMLPYSTVELYEGLERTECGDVGTWAYSNLGVAVLGEALTRAAGAMSYNALIEETMLKPLGMTHSGIDPTPEHEALFAAHHWTDDESNTVRERWVLGEVAAFGGLYSSVDDLAKFVSAQWPGDRESVLSDEARSLLHTPTVSSGDGRRMGLGWFVEEMPGGMTVFGHGGEVDGHSACLAVLPQPGVGMIILANRGGNSATTLVRAAMAGLLPRMMGGR